MGNTTGYGATTDDLAQALIDKKELRKEILKALLCVILGSLLIIAAKYHVPASAMSNKLFNTTSWVLGIISMSVGILYLLVLTAIYDAPDVRRSE